MLAVIGNYSGLRRRKSATPNAPQGNAPKRIIVLSQFYRPEPSRYPADVAEAFARDGYEVDVITGYPNRPGAKLHTGYQQRYGFSEVINGIRVHRVPLIINHSEKAVERIANYLTFALNALSMTSLVRSADAVYVYATPATAAVPAQVWQRIFGVPYVLHAQDLWPESVTESGMMGEGLISQLAGSVMKPWLKRLYNRAEALIAISPGMRELLVDRGANGKTCSVVYNWAIEATIAVKPSLSFSKKNLRLLYAGNIGPMQDLETVIAAARKYETQDGFSLSIAGGGVLAESLRHMTAELNRTKFYGLLSRSDVSELYTEADFQLVTLKDLPIFRTTIPSKLQSSLASGVPVITTVKGDVANLIQRYEAGLVAEPQNVESMAATFEQALKMSADERARMGKNARRLYEEQMSQSAGTEAIVSIMGRVSGRNPNNRTLEDIPSEVEIGQGRKTNTWEGIYEL